MQHAAESELTDLEQMQVSELHDRYTLLFQETPRSRNRRWLIRKIAWRIQSLSDGGLSERARQRAAELAVGADVRVMPPTGAASESAGKSTRTIEGKMLRKPDRQNDSRLPSQGTSLIREYKGQQIEVRVIPDGFEFAGDRYKSLSAIAKVITGSHCNGYRFFRLGNK